MIFFAKQSVESLKEKIADLEKEVESYNRAYEKNLDLYIEGYGEGENLDRCQARLERRISATQNKIDRLESRLIRLKAMEKETKSPEEDAIEERE